MDGRPDRLELDSQLTEFSRLGPWLEAMTDRLGLGERERYAIDLCMEEALVNVILHGYGSEPGHPIVIQTSVTAGTLSITVDDQAPPFSPLERLNTPPGVKGEPASLDSVIPGGKGVGLMHRFTESMHYERLKDGNRLTMVFPVPAPPSQ